MNVRLRWFVLLCSSVILLLVVLGAASSAATPKETVVAKVNWDRVNPEAFVAKTSGTFGYFEKSESRSNLFVNGKKIATYDEGLVVCLSDNGAHHLLVVRDNGKLYIVIDGKLTNYKSLKSPVQMSPDGQVSVFVTASGGKRILHLGSKELRKVDQVRNFEFLPQGHQCYWLAASGKDILFWRDDTIIGKGGKHKVTMTFGGRSYDTEMQGVLNRISFTSDGKHYAYATVKGGLYTLVVDGKDESIFGEPSVLTFNTSGSHLAYFVDSSAGKTVRVMELTTGKTKTFDCGKISDIVLSPDGETVYWKSRSSSDSLMLKSEDVYCNGKQVFSSSFYLGGITLSLDGKRLSIAAYDKVVIDDKESGTYEALGGGESNQVITLSDQDTKQTPAEAVSIPTGGGQVYFSPDSTHTAFVAKKGRKSFVVCDGEDSPMYDGIITGSFPNWSAGTLSYLAIRQGEIYRVVHQLK